MDQHFLANIRVSIAVDRIPTGPVQKIPILPMKGNFVAMDPVPGNTVGPKESAVVRHITMGLALANTVIPKENVDAVVRRITVGLALANTVGPKGNAVVRRITMGPVHIFLNGQKRKTNCYSKNIRHVTEIGKQWYLSSMIGSLNNWNGITSN
ncbi:MAG: hypothetical protein LBJ13_00560 [Puniceicoccales bacterium]|jgi:hypothetical protein|nr:hypothetical protein [Puniceicoccales bacterium]